MNKFCHLSLHSEYSINDGLVSMDDLAQKTSELGYESVAITDNSNLFGFVNFYQTMRENGIKPIKFSWYDTGDLKKLKHTRNIFLYLQQY